MVAQVPGSARQETCMETYLPALVTLVCCEHWGVKPAADLSPFQTQGHRVAEQAQLCAPYFHFGLVNGLGGWASLSSTARERTGSAADRAIARSHLSVSPATRLPKQARCTRVYRDGAQECEIVIETERSGWPAGTHTVSRGVLACSRHVWRC